MDKKGFLFTVTVFLILIYILLSISVWVKSIEASERTFSEFYKESTVELTIEQITPEKLDLVSNIIMNRNLARLNDYSIAHAVEAGPANDEFQNVRLSLFELLSNGTAVGSRFRGGVGMQNETSSSLTGWVQNLNASLKAIGVFVDDFEVSNFTLNQSDIDRLDYSFDLRLGLKDYANTSAVVRGYHISNSVSINGLVDPALARESNAQAGDKQTVYRQFFFKRDIYPSPASASVQNMNVQILGGQGWLYAPLAKASGSAPLIPDAAKDFAPITGDLGSYILVGTYSEIKSLTPAVYESFGGYIITSAPTVANDSCPGGAESNTFNPIKHSAPPNCTASFDASSGIMSGKPFIVAPNFNPATAPECPLLADNKTGRCVLIISTYLEPEVRANPAKKLDKSKAGIYDVEGLRDFVMCGYYTQNAKAPSYLQRLLPDAYFRNSSLGIETFVIGNYASNYSIYDMNSRLDRELFNGSINGIKVRGTPGCRNLNSCADSPITGIFAVSSGAKADYGLGPIACDNGAARCDK